MDLSAHGFSTPLHALNGFAGNARVVDVFDGDSLQVVLDDRGVAVRACCRISGIDTCEMRTKNSEAKAMAKRARDRMLSIISGEPEQRFSGLTRSQVQRYLDEQTCIVPIVCGTDDKYGRTLVKIHTDGVAEDGQDSLGDILVSEGFAVAYTGGTKMSEDEMLRVMAVRRHHR